MAIRFLYFDLGNVLLRFSNERMCAQVARLAGVDAQTVGTWLFGDGSRESPQWRFEAGGISPDDYFDHLCRVAGVAINRPALERAASDIFEPLEETLSLAESLAASGWRLGILSNTNPVHWAFVMDGRYPTLNRAFSVLATSFDARSMKPDPKVYAYAVRLAGVEPAEVFFTDDREENVLGARRAGFDAEVFVSAELLAAQLRQRGVCWDG